MRLQAVEEVVDVLQSGVLKPKPSTSGTKPSTSPSTFTPLPAPAAQPTGIASLVIAYRRSQAWKVGLQNNLGFFWKPQFCEQGPHASWKVMESPGFFLKIPGPGKSWQNIHENQSYLHRWLWTSKITGFYWFLQSSAAAHTPRMNCDKMAGDRLAVCEQKLL